MFAIVENPKYLATRETDLVCVCVCVSSPQVRCSKFVQAYGANYQTEHNLHIQYNSLGTVQRISAVQTSHHQ